MDKATTRTRAENKLRRKTRRAEETLFLQARGWNRMTDTHWNHPAFPEAVVKWVALLRAKAQHPSLDRLSA